MHRKQPISVKRMVRKEIADEINKKLEAYYADYLGKHHAANGQSDQER